MTRDSTASQGLELAAQVLILLGEPPLIGFRRLGAAALVLGSVTGLLGSAALVLGATALVLGAEALVLGAAIGGLLSLEPR